MAWTYVDPSSSDKDHYRFLLSDTDEEDPILQDEEINFVIQSTEKHYERLYMLFNAAATKFAREIENKVGPIEENPQSRMRYFSAKAKEYYDKAYGNTLAVPTMKMPTKANFRIGMHDNV